MDDNSAVVEKSRCIHEAGVQALESGKIEVFGGLFSMLEAIKDRFFVGGMREILWPHQDQGLGVLMQELDWIVSDLGNLGSFHFFRAGREYPFHFTLGEGKYSGENREEVFAKLKKDSEWKRFNAQFDTLEPVVFDTLVLDKTSLLLTASEIPPQIVALRNHLSAIYERHGLQPLKIENLLHKTLARIDQLESDPAKRRKQLQRYVELIQALRVYIKCHPIVMSGMRLRVSSSVDFFHGDTDLSGTTWGELLRKFRCDGDVFWCRLSGFDGSDGQTYLPHVDARWARGEGHWREGLLTAKRISGGFAFYHPGFWYPSSGLVEGVKFQNLHDVVGKRYAKIRMRT